jgi:hypothetical protein
MQMEGRRGFEIEVAGQKHALQISKNNSRQFRLAADEET